MPAQTLSAGTQMFRITSGGTIFRSAPLSRADETFTLRLDPATGDVAFRDPVADGSGALRIPIGTRAELDRVRDNLGGSYLQEADIDLMGNVPAAGNRTPIGTSSNHFTGSYDGGGFRLANLVINSSGTNNVGLFGCVGGGGSLSRIGIVSGSVAGTGYYVGGVCGWNNYGTITGCGDTFS